MKFYDMIFNDRHYFFEEEFHLPCELDEIEKEIPLEIREILINTDISRLLDRNYDNEDCIVDKIWDIVLDTCKNNIDFNLLSSLGITKDELIDDLKLHTIFTTFMSFRYREKKRIAKNEFIAKGYRTTTKNLYDQEEYISRTVNSQFKKLRGFLLDGSVNESSDFSQSIFNEIKEKELSDKKYHYAINFREADLFFEILKFNVTKFPYSSKNRYGMKFNDLGDFSLKLVDGHINQIEEPIDYCANIYIVERFFNLSFIYSLSNLIERYKIKDFEKISSILMELVNIVSLPIIFSRDKYIDTIYNYLFLGIENSYWTDRVITDNYTIKNLRFFKCLSQYIIPILNKVYYYLLVSYYSIRTQKNKACLDLNSIENTLEKYIEDNLEKFNYEEIKSNMKDIKNIDKKYISKEIQINLTYLVYRYKYERYMKGEYQTTEEFLKEEEKKEKDIIKILTRENYYYEYPEIYYDGFPYNKIYNNYLNNREAKKESK